MAALRKRDSLARDVERELKECLASCEAAAAHRDGADVAEVHEGGWKMSSGCEDETGFGLEDGTGFGLEDDMFDFTDEPCDVSCATCCVCRCTACHRVTLPRGPGVARRCFGGNAALRLAGPSIGSVLRYHPSPSPISSLLSAIFLRMMSITTLIFILPIPFIHSRSGVLSEPGNDTDTAACSALMATSGNNS